LYQVVCNKEKKFVPVTGHIEKKIFLALMRDSGTYRLLLGDFFSWAGAIRWGWVAGFIQWLGY